MTHLVLAETQLAIADSLTKSRVTENAEHFSQVDPSGIGITVIGVSVVFLALLLLYILFKNITRILNYKKNSAVKKGNSTPKKANEETLTGEVNAAIALALHLYSSEFHDYENTILTIKRVEKRYSPWSSKIYGLRQYPR